MSANLIAYLPELYRNIREFVELTEAENAELDSLTDAVTQLLDDQFVETASEQAIWRRELQLGIRADTTTETLEFRRKRLINRYSTKPPFTVSYLQGRLDFLIGPGRTTIEVDAQNFILKVTLSIPDAAFFKEIQHTIRAVKPANLVYIQATSLTDRIALEEHIWKAALTRRTRLSTLWRVGRTSFADRGTEVQVK
jgi:hypothetical protein